MIILDATTEKLQLVLGGAPSAELPYTSSYVDITTTTYTPGGNDGTSNSTTDVEIVGAPGASTQRVVKYLSVYNIANASATVTIKKDTSGTEKILCKVTLAVGDELQYSTNSGFQVITSFGNKKTSLVPGIGISAGTQSVSTGIVQFTNSNGVSFGMNGSATITASFSRMTVSFFEVPCAEFNGFSATNDSAGGFNLSIQRVMIPFDIIATRLDVLVHLTEAGSQSGTWSVTVGVYTRSQSTISLSTSSATGVQYASSAAAADTTATNAYLGISGTRYRSFAPNSWNFTPGEYWFAFINTAVGAGANSTPTISFYGRSSVQVLGMPGGNNDVNGAMGVFSAQTGAMPNSFNITSDIIFATTGVATESNILRQPYFRMFGTF